MEDRFSPRRGPTARGASSIALLLLAVLAAALAAAPPLPPKPTRYLTDNAGVFDGARAAALNDRLTQLERDTSAQVLVYVDRRVPAGTTLEEMGSAAIHTWGVGQKGKDNGVIFLVFTDDHKLRVEVGYGLESVLPDARAGEILSTVVKPRLRAGDVAGGIEAGADAIVAAVRGEGTKGTGREERQPLGLSIVAWVVMLLMGSFVLLILFIIVKAIVDAVRRPHKRGARSSSGWGKLASLESSSSDSFSSSSESSSSSSDFSGGGGDGGGGGASDSW